MADIEAFKMDDLKEDCENGRRSDFMQALGEALYACSGGDQQDRIISAYLTLQGVFDANSDNLGAEGDKLVENATCEFNVAVGKILGI